jgi:hypothetical protein
MSKNLMSKKEMARISSKSATGYPKQSVQRRIQKFQEGGEKGGRAPSKSATAVYLIHKALANQYFSRYAVWKKSSL